MKPIISLSRETTKFSTVLLARGLVLIALGIVAISAPDTALAGAMFTAAALLSLSGAYELFIALRTRHATPGWMVPMADGAACIGFAVLTLAVPGIPLAETLPFVAMWLALYAALTTTLTLALWPMTRTRHALLTWTAMNLLLSLLAVTAPDATISTLLFAGAGYAVAFGTFQLASGAWVRRIAVAYVAPTAQSLWMADASPDQRDHSLPDWRAPRPVISST